MFTPPEIATLEPLLDLDADLDSVEQEAQNGALPAEKVEFLATEYFNRAYMQRALHASQVLVELAPAKAAAWRLLANCQLDLAQDEQAQTSLDIMLNQSDKTAEDDQWAQDRLQEIAARRAGAAPSLAAETLAAVGGVEAPAAPPPAAPPASPAPAAAPPAAAPVPPPEPASALDIMAPAAAPEPERAGVAGALERQGIITVVASKDNDQLAEVRKLLDADPDNVDLLDWYAFALYTADRTEEAIEIYERLLRENEPEDKTYYYLGSAYLKRPDIRMAFRCFNELKRRFPNSKLNEKVEEKKAKLNALAK